MIIRIVSKDRKQAHEADGRKLERGVPPIPIVSKGRRISMAWIVLFPTRVNGGGLP